MLKQNKVIYVELSIKLQSRNELASNTKKDTKHLTNFKLTNSIPILGVHLSSRQNESF